MVFIHAPLGRKYSHTGGQRGKRKDPFCRFFGKTRVNCVVKPKNKDKRLEGKGKRILLPVCSMILDFDAHSISMQSPSTTPFTPPCVEGSNLTNTPSDTAQADPDFTTRRVHRFSFKKTMAMKSDKAISIIKKKGGRKLFDSSLVVY
jgi:hypothetical protein